MPIVLADDPADVLRPIPGWEGLYSVTPDGRVWSHERVIETKRGISWVQSGRWMRPCQTAFGYLNVTLRTQGGEVKVFVHRLVAIAFLGPATDDRPFVNHKDGCRVHNHVENLEWCSKAENTKHGYDNGRILTAKQLASLKAGRESRRSVSLQTAERIRARAQSGESQASIARDLGLTRPMVNQLVKNRTYRSTSGVPNAL